MFDSFVVDFRAYYCFFSVQDPSGWLRNGILLRMGGLGLQIDGLRPQTKAPWAPWAPWDQGCPFGHPSRQDNWTWKSVWTSFQTGHLGMEVRLDILPDRTIGHGSPIGQDNFPARWTINIETYSRVTARHVTLGKEFARLQKEFHLMKTQHEEASQ